MQRLAVGGMAEVFLAKKPGPQGFEKRVAVKRILPHLAEQPDFVAMFLDEARLAARLDHPHIVHLYDFGVDGDSYFLAMEYVCGEDLASIVARAREQQKPLPFADVVTILVDACEALHHAHEQGVVHRDVTPANLLVSYDGIVKLVDFGIAKSAAAATRTGTGTLKGKIPYMSPEQARAKELDRRSDIFSLGVCAWELLTGERLFQRKSELDMLRAVQMCDVSSAASVRPDVPPALAAAVERALAAAPQDRWATASEMAQALGAWLATTGAAPSKARLGATMTQLFGAGAAERRLRASEVTAEPTVANVPLPEAARGPLSPLHPERWIPQIAMHLHLPPPKVPRLRLLVPLLALLLSGGGLLFGHFSPHARQGLMAGLPIAAGPPIGPMGPSGAAGGAERSGTMPPSGGTMVPRSLHVEAPPPAPAPAPATVTVPQQAPVQTIVRSSRPGKTAKPHTRRQRRAHRPAV